MAGADGDNWVMKVAKLLLTEFDGRAKFGKFRQTMYQKGLLKGGISRVFKLLSSSNNFLLFEKDGLVRYISVCWKDAQICCGFRKRGWETCKRDNCSKFHVCKFFIAGNCRKGSSCLFGHDLENEANANTSYHLGMSSFSPDEIHTIIFCSTPAVCVSHNTGGCREDHCPDLHVCGLFVQQKCTSGNNCQFGHYLQTSEHNQWVLEAFDLRDFTDEELRKHILVRRVSTADRGLPSQMTPATSSLSLVSCTTAASPATEDIIATEDTDEFILSVFSFLLKRYGGRTKFDTFLSERGHLFRGFKRADIIQWFLDYNDRFLVYESDVDLKYVSAYSRRARVCFKYNDPDGSICDNQSCRFFHICKEFVADICVGSSCRLSHSFSSGPSAKMCSDLNLDQFTDTEICKLVLCSSPAVCVNYNTSGCNRNDCPDLHICSKYILEMCSSGDGCRFGHTIKDSGEHNQYVLKAFRMDAGQENVLRKMAIVKKREPRRVLQPVMCEPDRQPAHSNVSSAPVSYKTDIVQTQKLTQVADFLKPVKAKDINPGNYEHLCEMYTWTGVCPKTSQCPYYHSPDRLPYLWLLQDDDGEWLCVTPSVNADFEKIFCGLYDLRAVQLAIPGILNIDFSEMSATLEKLRTMHSVKIRRLSTPSYVTSVPGVPLHFCTQWVWYRQERDGTYTPFYPGALQYTLEEKYLKGQHTYYFEFEEFRLKVNTHSSPMVQENLDTQRAAQIVRRPVFVNPRQSAVSVMSPLLLSSVPESLPHKVPDHWSSVDHFQDFELVELRSDEAEYAEVHRQFFSTMNAWKHSIEHVFRVQNPGLWDKYCRISLTDGQGVALSSDITTLVHHPPALPASLTDWAVPRQSILGVQLLYANTTSTTFYLYRPGVAESSARRAMTPRGQKPENVKERQLFHGTPTLQSARGICANSFDFRRAGENVGAMYGRGAYFSTTAHCSHSYTRPHTRLRGRPVRFMFLGKILVGQYTVGQPSYTKPPERHGLKMYDSCVNDMSNPTIFVIFDLVQSYPAYLMQYTDSSDVNVSKNKSPPLPRPRTQASTAAATPKTTATSHMQASPATFVAMTTASTSVSTSGFSTSTASSAIANQTTSIQPSLPFPSAAPATVLPASGAVQRVSHRSHSPSLTNTRRAQSVASLAAGHVTHDVGLSASCTDIPSIDLMTDMSSRAASLSPKELPSSSLKVKRKKKSKISCTVS